MKIGLIRFMRALLHRSKDVSFRPERGTSVVEKSCWYPQNGKIPRLQNLLKQIFPLGMTQRYIYATTVFIYMFAMAFCAVADVPAAPLPATNPALEKFGAAVTFYVSFDQGAAADLSNGNGAPRDSKMEIELKPGLWGQAFLSGQKSIAYNAAQNVDLSKPGAVAVWISSFEWKRDPAKTAYIFFLNILDHGRQLMLARMGDPRNREAIYAHGKTGKTGKSVRAGNSRNWKDGEWHLLVANWRGTDFEISLDGGALHRQDMPAFENADGKTGQMFVGSKGDPNQRYLVDELLVLDRPLSQDEIQWMWKQTKPE